MFRREIFLERSGYTLRDLLVVVALIAIALTVGMPWMLQARVNSSQLHNNNQVKQLALALQNHNDQFKTFPPLFFSADSERKRILNPQLSAECYPWQVRLLPFLEEGKLYNDLERASQGFVLDSTQVQIPDPKDAATLISPSQVSISVLQSHHLDPVAPGECHYVAMPSTRLPLLTNITTDPQGNPRWKATEPDGMIIPDLAARGQSLGRVRDGTESTIVICETSERKRSNWFSPTQSFVCGFLPRDCTPVPGDGSQYYPYYDDQDRWQFDRNTIDRTAINVTPYYVPANDPLERAWGPAGNHPQGKMLVGMASGATLELDAEVDPAVFFSGITVSGGGNSYAIGDE